MRSVVALKRGVGDHSPERFADHEFDRNANHAFGPWAMDWKTVKRLNALRDLTKPTATPMLAEKFILLIETLKSHDGAPRIVSSSPHVPVKLPAASPITAR